MSSIDQAFIKAFARRNRPSQPASPNKPQSVAISGKPTVDAPPASPSSKVLPNRTPLQDDFLRIDPSINSSVELSADPSEERLVRVDSLKSDPVPAPHAAPKPQPGVQDTLGPAANPGSANPGIDVNGTAEPASEPPSSRPFVELPNAIEKTTEHILSAQDSLDLLQHSFTTLEAVAQPDQGFANTYVADVTTPLPETGLDPVPESETTQANDESPEAPTPEAPAIVQRRIDSASQGSEVDHLAQSAKNESPENGFGLTGASPESLYLRPVWEVDVFDVPTAVADLFFDGPLFQQIAERVLQAVNSGLTSMMVTSVHRGEGRSTVAIGMAMAAAAAGLRVVLIDADTDEPTLQDDLRLDLEYGWVDTVRGGLAIREVAVHAVEDGVTLIPLMPPNGNAAATDIEIVQMLQSLRGKFDLIVIDTPSLESSSTLAAAAMVDSALIVRDTSRTDADTINQLSHQLREKGVQGIGVIDNFA